MHAIAGDCPATKSRNIMDCNHPVKPFFAGTNAVHNVDLVITGLVGHPDLRLEHRLAEAKEKVARTRELLREEVTLDFLFSIVVNLQDAELAKHRFAEPSLRSIIASRYASRWVFLTKHR